MAPVDQTPPACKDHPKIAALARCATCHRALCDECFRFRVATKPSCARCAYEASTRSQRRLSLAAAFLCFAIGGGVYLARATALYKDSPGAFYLGAIVAVGITLFIGVSARGEGEPTLENREPGEDGPLDEVAPAQGSAYRAYARRAIHAISPRLSGRATALVVGLSLSATAILLPVTLHLPQWVETEIVFGVWWVIVTLTLVTLLYRGFRLRDDLVVFLPWDRPAASAKAAGAPKPKGKSGGASWADGCSIGDGCSGLDGEGCGGALAVIAVIAVALGAAWIFVELVMPVVFFLTYWLFMRGIGRVANDRRGCEGDFLKSLGWGALWATVYVLPLGGITWALHVIHKLR